jgi:uncharacterized protein (TIGR02145 family)
MCINKIAFTFLLIPAILFLQGCQDNIIIPDTVNQVQTPRLLYSPKGTPCTGIPTVDYSGKTYHTVQIGHQCWLRENLDVGTMIKGSNEQRDNGIIEKYCYNDSIENCNIYGGLYQWNELMQYTTIEGTQGICPTGWHIPTFTEFETLSTIVGGDGNALKAIGQGLYDGTGTNSSGFSALLVGFRGSNGSSYGLGLYAVFWSSSMSSSISEGFLGLYYSKSNIYVLYREKYFGYSIRCIKN